MSAAYCPSRGDVIWISFQPQTGSEQSGRRPALVLSPEGYNRKVGLVLLCPITTQIKGYPFEVVIPEGHPVSGAILSDQVKSFDWRVRDAAPLCVLPDSSVQDALKKINILLEP